MSRRRAVITGIGPITCIGTGVDRFWNGMLAENRQPLADFSQNGLGQIAPTLAELRVLVRDLRRISSRLDRNPAGYATGRTHPEEFSPNESK